MDLCSLYTLLTTIIRYYKIYNLPFIDDLYHYLTTIIYTFNNDP
jgi:hypothetical protein